MPSYNSSGGVFFIPPEYYGLPSIGQALQQTGTILTEKKRYKTEKERLDRQEAIQKFKLGFEAAQQAGAPADFLSGMYKDFFKKGFDPKWSYEDYVNDQVQNYVTASPEERASFDPFVKRSVFQNMFGSPIDPGINEDLLLRQLDLAGLQVEGMTLDNTIAQANNREVTATRAAAGDFLKDVGLDPEAGLTGARYYFDQEIGKRNILTMDADLRMKRKQMEMLDKQMDLIDSQVAEAAQQSGWTGPLGELKIAKAQQLAERIPLLSDYQYIVDYLDGKEVPESLVATFNGAERMLQEETDAVASSIYRKAQAEGDVALETLNSLLQAEKAFPGATEGFRDVITSTLGELVQRYAAGSVSMTKSDPVLWFNDPTLQASVDLDTLANLESTSITRSLENYILQQPGGQEEEKPFNLQESTDEVLGAFGNDSTQALEYINGQISKYEGKISDEQTEALKSIANSLTEQTSQIVNEPAENPKVPTNIMNEPLEGLSLDELQERYDALRQLRNEMRSNIKPLSNTPLIESMKKLSESNDIARRAAVIYREILRRRQGG